MKCYHHLLASSLNPGFPDSDKTAFFASLIAGFLQRYCHAYRLSAQQILLNRFCAFIATDGMPIVPDFCKRQVPEQSHHKILTARPMAITLWLG